MKTGPEDLFVGVDRSNPVRLSDVDRARINEQMAAAEAKIREWLDVNIWGKRS